MLTPAAASAVATATATGAGPFGFVFGRRAALDLGEGRADLDCFFFVIPEKVRSSYGCEVLSQPACKGTTLTSQRSPATLGRNRSHGHNPLQVCVDRSKYNPLGGPLHYDGVRCVHRTGIAISYFGVAVHVHGGIIRRRHLRRGAVY